LIIAYVYEQILSRGANQDVIECLAPFPDTGGTNQLVLEPVTVAIRTLDHRSEHCGGRQLDHELAEDEEVVDERGVRVLPRDFRPPPHLLKRHQKEWSL
jgi:hypothetical protein